MRAGCAGHRRLVHCLSSPCCCHRLLPATPRLLCLQAIDVVRELQAGTREAAYLEAVRGALAEAFERCQPAPDLLIYNAGTDVLEGEWLRRAGLLGTLRLSVCSIRTLLANPGAWCSSPLLLQATRWATWW